MVLTALQSFHLLVLGHIADMLFHLSPQVVAIVENIWLVVAASIVLVFCLVFVMPEELLLGQDHSANFSRFLSVPDATTAAHFSVWE